VPPRRPLVIRRQCPTGTLLQPKVCSRIHARSHLLPAHRTTRRLPHRVAACATTNRNRVRTKLRTANAGLPLRLMSAATRSCTRTEAPSSSSTTRTTTSMSSSRSSRSPIPSRKPCAVFSSWRMASST
jgi:hypothetical protein